MTSYAEQLETAVSTTGVTGASLAYWDGNGLHTGAAGLRNSVTGDPVTTDTVMHIGSITKIFNTTLLMQLVDDGKVAPEDPVTKHLPDLRIRDMNALKHITCAMLVNHTSGIDCDWLPEYGPDQERIVDSVNRCADLEQLFQPGEATSYNNMATVIAGHLTQTLRGISWYTLVKTRIFEPLEMNHALAEVTDTLRFRGSIGDLTDPVTGKMVQTKRPFLATSFAPAGSTLMTSATDLVTFARALLNGGVGINGNRILSASSAARMMKPTASFVSPPDQIGLGWMISPGNLLHHGGGGPGVHSMLYIHPESKRAVALLTNCDRGGAVMQKVLDPITESWTGIKAPVHQRVTGAIDLQPYEGTYESNLQRAEVFVRDGGLVQRVSVKMDLYDNSSFDPEAAASKGRVSRLYPIGDDGFEEESSIPGMPSSQLKFWRPDASGRMQFLANGCRLLKRVK